MQTIFWGAFIAGTLNGLLIAVLSNRGVPYWQRVIVSVVITAIAWLLCKGMSLS